MPDTECIHGFEAGLCDSCYPKKAPEKPAVVAKVRALRAPAAPRSTAAPRRSVSAKPLNLAEQRVYHVVSIDDLGEVVDAGEIGAGARFLRQPDASLWAEGVSRHDHVVLVTTLGHLGDDLVPGRSDAMAVTAVPFSAIQLVAVANDRARSRAREVLGDAASGTRISIYPPWFQAD